MKVAELRQKIQAYSRDKLERIVLETYKAMPKSMREVKGIDSIINNPDAKPAKPSAPVRRDLEDIRWETEEFLSNAYDQYYFAPNSVVPKSKRPGWRFIARRLFKELCEAAKNQDDAAAAAGLLESLYKMLCYSCGHVLFSGYDSFDSVGIRQVEFYQAILDIERKLKPPREFIRNSVLLALGNSLNRYTLWEDLLEVIVARLDTVDMREMAIEVCDELRKQAAAGSLRNVHAFSDGPANYKAGEFIKHLAILGWMCHMGLDQPEDAARYFLRYYAEKDQEIALYVLLRLIEHRQSWALWLRTYSEALSRGICPRKELQQLFTKIQEKNEPGRQDSQISE